MVPAACTGWLVGRAWGGASPTWLGPQAAMAAARAAAGHLPSRSGGGKALPDLAALGLPEDVWSWDVSTVGLWLQKVAKLEEYVETFGENEVDGETLLELNDGELQTDLSVLRLGHRKVLANGIRQLRLLAQLTPLG